MNFVEFTAGKDDDGKRFDRVARHVVSIENLSTVYKSIRKGFLRLNGKKVSPDTRIKCGDIIIAAEFLLPQKSSSDDAIAGDVYGDGNDDDSNSIKKKSAAAHDAHDTHNTHNTQSAHDFPFPVIFENEHIIIINKPYDVCTHHKDFSDKNSVAFILQKFFPSNSLSFMPSPLHRLDRRTTGILVCSKSIEGARWFTQEIKHHNIQKKYLAIVEGKISLPETWTDEIENVRPPNSSFFSVSIKNQLAHSSDNVSSHAACNAAHTALRNAPRNAITKVSPVSVGFFAGKNYTLVECDIATGRKHQIRAQSAFHGHPLLGDTAYGAKKLEKDFFSHYDFDNGMMQTLFLHAHKIYFPENHMEVPRSHSASIPQNFIDMKKKLGL